MCLYCIIDCFCNKKTGESLNIYLATLFPFLAVTCFLKSKETSEEIREVFVYNIKIYNVIFGDSLYGLSNVTNQDNMVVITITIYLF